MAQQGDPYDPSAAEVAQWANGTPDQRTAMDAALWAAGWVPSAGYVDVNDPGFPAYTFTALAGSVGENITVTPSGIMDGPPMNSSPSMTGNGPLNPVTSDGTNPSGPIAGTTPQWLKDLLNALLAGGSSAALLLALLAVVLIFAGVTHRGNTHHGH